MAGGFHNKNLFPLLSEEGHRLLQWLHEHKYAPHYTHPGCDRLTAEGLEKVRAFEAELDSPQQSRRNGEMPDWLKEHVETCYRDVPFYRRSGSAPSNFTSIPTTNRRDLSREPWAFVPDSQPLNDLVIYQTSGTTGHPLDVLTHPTPLAMYLPLLRTALAMHGVKLEGHCGRVSIILVCFQKSTYTYASISPVLNQAGLVKINLNPADWRDISHMAKFLDACDPEIYTGDPISFAELSRLPLQTRPKAIVSTAMTLLPGRRHRLEQHFGCPVIDIYSMNETGPIAVWLREAHVVLQKRLYIEVLDRDGFSCPSGVHGEVTVTGGFNPFLPLLKYRTGDWARLAFHGTQVLLEGLEGRPPVIFRGRRGQPINNIDVSTVLKPLLLVQYSLHQNRDDSLHLRVHGRIQDQNRLRDIIISLFGEGQRLFVEEVDSLPAAGKILQYSRDDE